MQTFATTRSDQPRHPSATITFLRHYAEMVAAMLLGMAVFAPLLELSDWRSDAPALYLLGMAFAMTLPMVAWMRHRGHAWERGLEMAAAMFAPTFAALALLAGGLVEDTHALLMIQHIAMFPAMLGVMLLRRDEYTGRER